ncbi:MAG: hypothetical protein RMJ98_08100, partial [Myxococcales bacterium]|nr:hypothetical protein [Polyangiaceae bacterium]MDW8249248.1 hypothetical protein [Myxococcales bacterium]
PGHLSKILSWKNTVPTPFGCPWCYPDKMPRRALFSLVTAVSACQSTPWVSTPEPVLSSTLPAPSPNLSSPLIPAPSDGAWSVLPRSVRPSDEEFLEAFRSLQVTHDVPARRVLYSWTTQEQAAALRRNRRLLVKGSQDTPLSIYDASLWQLYNQERLARLLFNPPFLLHRYAWASAWATRFSPDAGSYGDELLRISLKEDALVVAFFPHAPKGSRWAIFDLRGQRRTEAEALQNAGRIAAVYHVHLSRGEEPTFREFIVCNEAMVESWALATHDIREQLRKEQRALDLWRRSQADGRPGLSPQEILLGGVAPHRLLGDRPLFGPRTCLCVSLGLRHQTLYTDDAQR